MSVSSVTSAAPQAARAIRNDGDGDDMKAAAPKAAARPSDGDADDQAISGATKPSALTSPALQSVISSLSTRS